MTDIEDRTFIFFHHEGQVLVPGSINSAKLEVGREVKKLSVQISGMELISDQTRTCDLDKAVYDTCLLDYWIKNSDNCTLPFFYSNQTTTCRTFKEGEMALKTMFQLGAECLQPCVQFEMKIVETPVLYTDSRNFSLILYQSQIGAHLSHTKLHAGDTLDGYLVYLPKFISYRKSGHDYDGVSYVAEFAGWAGLFLGVSLSGGLFVILQHIQSLKPLDWLLQMCIKGIMFMIYILCMVFLAYLTVTLVSKLMDNCLSTSISLEETKVDFALTVCATHIIREAKNSDRHTYHSIITDILYSKWNNLSSKISKISISANGVENVFDPEDLGRVSQINLPLTIGTVDFCHTINLSFFERIDKIIIYATSEVKIFLHYPGQFMYAWNNWKNVFTSVNKDSYQPMVYDNGYNLYGIDITVKLEKTLFSIKEPTFNFDECFLQNLLANEDLDDRFKEFIQSSERANFSGKALVNFSINIKISKQGNEDSVILKNIYSKLMK